MVSFATHGHRTALIRSGLLDDRYTGRLLVAVRRSRRARGRSDVWPKPRCFLGCALRGWSGLARRLHSRSPKCRDPRGKRAHDVRIGRREDCPRVEGDQLRGHAGPATDLKPPVPVLQSEHGSTPAHSYHEYQCLLEVSGVKLEYCDGEIYAMAGGTPSHADLAASAMRLLRNALLGRCRVSSSDLKVRIEETDLSTFPDVEEGILWGTTGARNGIIRMDPDGAATRPWGGGCDGSVCYRRCYWRGPFGSKSPTAPIGRRSMIMSSGLGRLGPLTPPSRPQEAASSAPGFRRGLSDR